MRFEAVGPAARGVTVDLPAGEARGAAEGVDAVAGFEDAGGGDGPDLLIGTDGPNRLAGGSGPDRQFGGAGDDRLAGGRGYDVLDGGAGDDLFVAGVELGRDDMVTYDRFTCGDGIDPRGRSARRRSTRATAAGRDTNARPYRVAA